MKNDFFFKFNKNNPVTLGEARARGPHWAQSAYDILHWNDGTDVLHRLCV